MNVLALVQNLFGYLHAHPRESAVISLVLALLANWTFGTVDAIVRRDFSFVQWPRILQSQLASTEAKVIAGMLITAAVSAYTKSVFPGNATQLVNLLVDALLDALAAASALYSAALWREDVTQLHDIESAVVATFSGKALPPRRNVRGRPPAVVGQG